MSHLRRLTLLLGLVATAFTATPSEYVVQVQATTQAAPPSVILAWVTVPGGGGYSVARRTWDSQEGFAVVADGLPATASSWTDTAISAGTRYEYQIHRTGKPDAYGYAAVGIELPLVDQRGTVVLLVDATMAAPLANELTALQGDLASDGWKVLRHDVARSTAVCGAGYTSTGSCSDGDKDAIPAIRALVKADADGDPAVSHVLIVGNVPIPYAGKRTPDGHGQHVGAWPADVYYGDLDGNWTDAKVDVPYKSQAGGDNSANLIGDGRFDQEAVPGSGRQLAVGRVDLSHLPMFLPASETGLLRRYLAKEHAWRSGRWNVPTRCLVDDATFGDLGGWAVVGGIAWGASGVVGLGHVDQGDWMTSLPDTGYLYAVGGGFGTWGIEGGWSCSGVVTTRDLADVPSLGVFTSLFGSYFIDWNRTDDLLRAVLANDGYGLTCLAAGRPCVFYHRMALGATIGDAWQITQDHHANRYQRLFFDYERSAYLGLMGDPTLRAHPVAPPTAPSAATTGNQVALRWTASTASGVIGYHVYRATSADGPFTRISGVAASAADPAGSPVSGTTWTDPSAPTGTQTYLIKAICRQSTPGGTFINASLGTAVAATSGGQTLAIATQPAGTTVAIGQTARFTVAVEGSPAPAIQWYRDGIAIPGATSASYTTPAAHALADDGTQYRAAASNALGTVLSEAAMLTVAGLTSQPAEQVVVEIGKAATFAASATGCPPTTTWQWFRDGAAIPASNHCRYTTAATVAADHGAVFTAKATIGGIVVASRPSRLVVNAPKAALAFTAQPQSVTVAPGQTATFAAAAPAGATLQWQRNGVRIDGATSPSFTTAPATAGDHGAVFAAVATQGANVCTSEPAVLGVRSKSPVFVADFNGRGFGTGGTDDMIAVGGTAAMGPLTTVNRILGAKPFSAGSGTYLNIAYADDMQPQGAYQNVIRFIPTSPATGFASFYGGTVTNAGKRHVVLNGGYDLFVRPNKQGDGELWVLLVANGIHDKATTGLNLNLAGGGNDTLQFNLSTGAANGVLDFAKVAGDATTDQKGIRLGGSTVMTKGAVHHIAFVLSTDPTGLITAKLFIVPGTGPIDTAGGAGLCGKATCTLDADIVGPDPLAAGAWTIGRWFKPVQGTDADFDSIRLYNSDPGTFPALP